MSIHVWLKLLEPLDAWILALFLMPKSCVLESMLQLFATAVRTRMPAVVRQLDLPNLTALPFVRTLQPPSRASHARWNTLLSFVRVVNLLTSAWLLPLDLTSRRIALLLQHAKRLQRTNLQVTQPPIQRLPRRHHLDLALLVLQEVDLNRRLGVEQLLQLSQRPVLPAVQRRLSLRWWLSFCLEPF